MDLYRSLSFFISRSFFVLWKKASVTFVFIGCCCCCCCWSCCCIIFRLSKNVCISLLLFILMTFFLSVLVEVDSVVARRRRLFSSEKLVKISNQTFLFHQDKTARNVLIILLSVCWIFTRNIEACSLLLDEDCRRANEQLTFPSARSFFSSSSSS